MGLASKPSAGKSTYLINGLKDPFMVNYDRQEETFKLLCEWYVHGEMDGAYRTAGVEQHMRFK